MNSKIIIALDLGATKCAAGIVEYHPETNAFICKKTCSVKLAETHSLEDMLQQIAAQLDMPFHNADAVCIGAAGQYNGRVLHHLAGVYPYEMNFAEIAHKQKWQRYAVIHDYDSIVCATFTSYMQHDENILRLNSCTPDPYKRRVALGLGTGLGLKDGVLLPSGDFWLGKNEIGHIGIINPPLTDNTRLLQHQEFLQFLRSTHHGPQKTVTLESMLTGRGLVNLYQFLYADAVTPEIAGDKMKAGSAPELLDLFAWYLGLFVGSVQLILMPEGGIWITGGVVLKHLEIFSQPSFTAGMQTSPAFQLERESYALGVLKNPEHALIGAAFYAVKRLLGKPQTD